MQRDFAKKPKTDSPKQSSGFTVFTTGFALGLFTAFLFYLWFAAPPVDRAVERVVEQAPSEAAEDQELAEINYEFYDLFPNSVVPVETRAPLEETETEFSYLLQAGSFREQADADRRRASLILLGFDVFIRQAEHDEESWHRVMVGPFDSERDLTRARNALAEADIATLQMRVAR